MLRLLLIALLFYPMALPAQQISISAETIFATLQEKYRQGRLDSIKPTVKINEGFGRIDTSRWFYTYTDTVYNEDKTWAVGKKIIDPLMEFNNCRIGMWQTRYSNGQLLSMGDYVLAATVSCQSGGAFIRGYSYRSGFWQYWYANGSTMALGQMAIRFYSYDTGCREDNIYVGALGSNWVFYNEKGRKTGSKKILFTKQPVFYSE
jgi:hypothetical protein